LPTEGWYSIYLLLTYNQVTRLSENSLTRCSKCKAPVKDTDAVLDAIRVGQEALDKAEALQFSGMTSFFYKVVD